MNKIIVIIIIIDVRSLLPFGDVVFMFYAPFNN